MIAATLITMLSRPKPSLLRLTVERIELFKRALIAHKIADKYAVYGTETSGLWEDVEAHLSNPDKDFKGYDRVVKRIKTTFGEAAWHWVLMNTRFMTQTTYMLRKNYSDVVVDSPAKLLS